MEQKRIKVRLTENSPYSEYGYYKRGDIGYIDGYVSGCAVIILKNGKFAKAELRWIEVVNEEDKNTNTELKESEEEKMIQYFKDLAPFDKAEELYEKYGFSHKDAIAWLEKQGEQIDIANKEYWRGYREGKQEVLDKYTELEKQGEQKPWSEEDETIKNNISHIIRQYDKISKRENQPCYYVGDCLLWMQNIKDRVQPQPNQEWSEEDRKMMRNIIDDIHCGTNFNPKVMHAANEREKWFKSICMRYQSKWKPSDEQVEALLKLEEMHVLEHERNQENAHLYMVVKSIREQLLKLREE